MKIVKGYIAFNLNKDIELNGSQIGYGKIKKYTLKQQEKQCEKAYKELKKQEAKGLINNLTYTELNGKVTITWDRVS